MKITTVKKCIAVILFSAVATIMFPRTSLAGIMPRPETVTFYSYRTVTTGELVLPKDQTVYLSYTLTYNGYFKIKKPDNTIVLDLKMLSNPLPVSGGFYLQAGTYTVETYGGDGMAYGHGVNDNGVTVNVTYINQPTGKLLRIIEGTGSFTTNITTTIYYDWSGGNGNTSLYSHCKLGSLQFTGPTSNVEGPNPAINSFIGKPGTYTVQCTGGYYTPQMTSTIYITGSVDIWYDDTKPQVQIDSSKKEQWIQGSSDGSIKADYQITFPNGTPNIPEPLLVKVFFGPEGQTATLHKSYSYNPATPTNITGDWPVPADANGRYQAYAELWENNGANLKIKTSNVIYFNIDNTPPTLNVTRSPEQAYYSTATVINFDYTAVDTGGSGFNEAVVNINGIPQSPALLTQSGTYQWTTPNSGQHTILFTAYDSAGNQSTQSFTINIDDTNPEFPGSLRVNPVPAYLSYVNSPTVTYSWPAVNEEHFKEYRIKIEAAYLNNPTGWTTVRDWTSTGNETSYPYTIPAECDGQMLKATVKAVDLAGNEANISKTIISDQSVPEVVVPEYAARFQTGAVPGTGKAVCRWNPINDDIDGVLNSGSGIEHYEIALTETAIAPDQSTPLQTADTSTNQYEFSNISSSGAYYFWVRGVDRAGNAGTWTMHGPFPDFSVNGPENNTIITTAAFQAVARNPLPGNKELRFKLKYKQAESGSYSSLPGDYQTATLVPVLSRGIWNWYLELKEYDQTGNPIPASLQTTEVFTFQMAGDIVEPVTLRQFFTTPGAFLQLTAMVAEPGRITEYRWDTGDGNTVNGQSPQYSYGNQLDYDPVSQTASKVYPLTLTVAYDDGSTYTVQSTVTVQNTARGRLHMNENWQGIHRLYGDVIVPEGVSLTILPGTQVIIEQSPGQTGYGNALIINGTMNAGPGVVFQLANGTTLDGWKGITITGQALLDQVAVYNAQRAVTTVGTDNVSIVNSTISGNYTGVHVCGGHPVISGTLFSGNRLYAVKEENGWPRVTHCTFTGNGIDYYHDTLTKITPEQLNALPDRGNEGNQNQD